MLKSVSEIRTMIDKFTAVLSDSGEEGTAAQGIRDALIWVLNDGSRDDYDLEQFLPEDDEGGE